MWFFHILYANVYQKILQERKVTMCFYLYPKYTGVKIAKRDKTCYKKGKYVAIRRNGKVFEHFQANVFYWFRYKPGVEVKMPDGEKLTVERLFNKNGVINAGLHSYDRLTPRLKMIMNQKGAYAVGQFVIPKGANYYYNPCRHEYVSDRIKLVKFLYKGKKK